MIPQNIQPADNFPPQNLLPSTQSFFNSKEFMQNEVRFLGTQLGMLNKALSEGLKQIKEAIEGKS